MTQRVLKTIYHDDGKAQFQLVARDDDLFSFYYECALIVRRLISSQRFPGASPDCPQECRPRANPQKMPILLGEIGGR
jgi:hypothetical protein